MPAVDGLQPQSESLNLAISSALGVVWKTYAGRKITVATNVKGTKVACVLEDSVQSFNDRLGGHADDEEALELTASGYRRAAISAISKATHQRVSAFISKHDEKTDVATEVFILDAPPRERAASLTHTPRQ